jgi:hypothetical protein
MRELGRRGDDFIEVNYGAKVGILCGVVKDLKGKIP